MAKVVKTDTCWNWIGSLSKGYGQIRHDGRVMKPHRVMYEIHRGPIPKGLLVRHLCHNRVCMNPWHLEVGTYQDNRWDDYEPAKFRNPTLLD